MSLIYPALILLVEGKPNNGKTSFALAMTGCHTLRYWEELPKGRTEWTLLLIDDIISSHPVYKNLFIRNHNNIERMFMYEDLSIWEPLPYLVYARVLELASLGNTKILVEGYLAEHIKKVLCSLMPNNLIDGDTSTNPQLFLGNAVVSDFSVTISGSTITSDLEDIAEARESKQSGKGPRFEKWLGVKENVNKILDSLVAAKIRKASNYQSFDILGMNTINSDTKEKWKRSGLSDISCGAVLDIGCNFGYSCMLASASGATSVCGLDFNTQVASYASVLSNIYVGDHNIHYEVGDYITAWEPGMTFDVIVMGGVFHYFRDKQEHAIFKSSKLLNPNGKVLIEVGLPEDPDNTELVQRSVDAVACHFPGENVLDSLFLRFGLHKLYKQDSVQQPGDPVKRYWMCYSKNP